MRPHKLVMKAFGPFARETTVDFDAMGSSIYLISGDTGAGKTTIFDAIVYALYGTASGGGREKLGGEAFHSDFAKHDKKRDEMRVDFTFSNAGHTYTVTRKLSWGKRGESQKADLEAILSEGGNTLVTSKGKKNDEVTQKLEEILGLNAEQFRRIIMLAQGEFQKFLNAGSAERGDILGRLYNNSRHLDFQARLKAAAEQLKARDKALVSTAKSQCELLSLPEERFEASVCVDNPDLLSTLASVLEQMTVQESELDTEYGKQQLLQQTKTSELARGKERNRQLKELETSKNGLAALTGQAAQMDALRESLSLAQSAAKVLPLEQAKQTAEAALSDNQRKLESLARQETQQAQQLQTMRTELAQLEAVNAPKIQELTAQKTRLEGILPVYDDLQTAQDTHKAKRAALTTAEKAVRDTEAEKNSVDTELSTLKSQLDALRDAGEAAVALARSRKESLLQKQTELTAIGEEVSKLQKQEAEAGTAQQLALDANRKALAAEETHLQLNRAFLDGQAAFLAGKLRETLLTQETAICPVCGTIHTGADADRFAVQSGEVPTKETVDNAFDTWNAFRETASEAEKQYTDCAAKLTEGRKALLARSELLLPDADWRILCEGTVLRQALADCKAELTKAQNALREAEKQNLDKAAALQKQAELTQIQTRLEIDWETAKQARSAAEADAAATESSVTALQKQLADYPAARSDADAQLQALTQDRDRLQRALNDAGQKLQELEKTLSATKGAATTTRDAQPALLQAKLDALTVWETELALRHFSDEAAYRSALSPEGTALDARALEAWIAQQAGRLQEYDSAVAGLRTSIGQQERATKDFVYMDTRAAQEALDSLSDTLSDLQARRSRLHTRLETNRKVYAALDSILRQRQKLRRVDEILAPLAEAANGRLAFSRFVLIDFFRRIVDQANIHLETMTDNEYVLVAHEDGDARSNLGLGLMVLNTLTGLERDTRSLSGGQTFEASLSLALGLSDVVQMESTGNVQVDSMFIDEGFGSLDTGRLDKAIGVLNHLSGGKRQIGIISHVARLDECLPKKIRVIAGKQGSTVSVESDT